MIWGFPLPWNRLWNVTYILKKNKDIRYKNSYIFPNGNKDPNDPHEVISGVPPLWKGLWNQMYILKKNKYIFCKNIYIFSKGNQESFHLYYDLYIPLGTLGKWFEMFSHFEMNFGTLRAYLRKINTSLMKINIFFRKISTFLPRGT